MQPEAGRSGGGRLLVLPKRNRDWVQYAHGFRRVDRGASHFRAGAVKKQDTAGEALGGRVEELTQGAENDGQWTSVANQSADRPTDFGGAGPHPGCGSLFCCGAISGFALAWRRWSNMPLR